MKHKLRAEKNCLNCGARVEEIFCPHCGQENIDTHESFGTLLYHFFSDFTHFDSKFSTTLKDLLFRPGFLTKQYLAGKRNSYLHPIRMYIFISFVFFLALGLISNHLGINQGDKNGLLTANDSLTTAKVRQMMDSLKADPGVTPATLQALDRVAGKLNIPMSDTGIGNHEAKDTLSGGKATTSSEDFVDGLRGKRAKWQEKYGANYTEIIIEKIIHDIPKALFLLLPLFALYLKGFYRKKSYVDHAVFALHYHSFIFLLLLLSLLIDYLLGVSVTGYAMLLMFIYLVAGLHHLYYQSLIRSFFKGALLSIMYLISIFIVLIAVSFIVFVMI